MYFEHTYEMLPGRVLEYCNGEIHKHEYWNIMREYHRGATQRQQDFEACKSSLKSVLKDAVAARLVADVPVGTFLSGGIDSTLVTAIARECKETQLTHIRLDSMIKSAMRRFFLQRLQSIWEQAITSTMWRRRISLQ